MNWDAGKEMSRTELPTEGFGLPEMEWNKTIELEGKNGRSKENDSERSVSYGSKPSST